jgi:hypothetical protein
MQAADNLYGITMEEPGISKLVAVRFTDQEEGENVVETLEPQSLIPEPLTEIGEDEPLNEALPDEIKKRINPEITFAQDDE